MKYILRMFIRKFLKSRKSESIIDTIERRKKNIAIKMSRRKFSNEDFCSLIKKLGIENGDYVFLHSSIKSFFEFPDIDEAKIINCILETIGEDGVLMMPGYGSNKTIFDVNNTVSVSGKISKYFSQMEGVIRSLDAYFSVSYFQSKKTKIKYKDKHVKSINPFDENSPFYDLLLNDGKILCLGIGKYPIKISFIHYITFFLFKNENSYQNVFKKYINTNIITKEGKHIEKEILVRKDFFQNNNKIIKKLVKQTPHAKYNIGYLRGYCCNAKDMFEKGIEFNKSGLTLYKKTKKVNYE
ncbi:MULTISPECIES: AAC(3) family N-acetyltransferase [Enterococcus]|nr:AAC(3) family N-acetyltransferase [Enterococcus faecium]